MAIKYYTGQAPYIAQYAQSGALSLYADGGDQVCAVRLTINGITIEVEGRDPTATIARDEAVRELISAVNQSAYDYFKAIYITGVDIGGDDLYDVFQVHARIAGVPFEATGQTEISSGSWLSLAINDVVENSSPQDVRCAANWSGGTLPTGGDTIIFADSDVDIAWGLDEFATTIFAGVEKSATFTGRIGLDYLNFAKTPDARQVYANTSEYRQNYFQCQCNGSVRIGTRQGVGNADSARVMFDFNGSSPEVYVNGTAARSCDVGRPAVRIMPDAFNIFIQDCPGGVGLGDEVPDESGTITKLTFLPTGRNSWIVTGSNTKIVTYVHREGRALIKETTDMTSATVDGGICEFRGDGDIDDLYTNGGDIYIHNYYSGGNDVDNLHFNGGRIDLSYRSQPLTVDEIHVGDMLNRGEIIAPDDMLVITTGINWDGKISLINRKAS